MPRPSDLRTLTAAVLVLAAGATTAPTTAPVADAPDLHVVRWVGGLANPDPAVRATSRELLTGLPRDDLVWLLRAVRSAGPIGPAQAAELREVVAQVYLAGEPYDAAAGHGPDDVFHPPDRPLTLGLGWPVGAMASGSPAGLTVADRWPGFPARRWLRAGDVIGGVAPISAGQVRQGPIRPVRSSNDLNAALAEADTGELQLVVRRDGGEAVLLVRAVPLPADTAAGPARIAAFFAARQRRFDLYWGAVFGPALARPATPVGTGGRP